MVSRVLLFVVMLAANTAGASVAENGGVGSGNQPLDKTWTTRGQETKPGSQVLDFIALTSPTSFLAERTGLSEIAFIYPSARWPSNLILMRK